MTHPLLRRALTASLVLSCSAPPSLARAPEPESPPARGSYDDATGRNLLNYPPHRFVDHLSMSLDITIPDMNVPRFEARERLTFVPLARDLDTLTLHAAGLDIRSLTSSSGGATFRLDPASETLSVTFDPPALTGVEAALDIEYTVDSPADGVIWTPEYPSWPGRPASLHTQGEPESNRHWFVCHDFPNERLRTDLTVTVPAGFTACSNGALIGRATVRLKNLDGEEAAYERFRFAQDREHVSYLVSLAVGRYDVVDVAPRGSKVPMPVYAPRGQGDRVRATFGRTPEMVDLLAAVFDEPYPWDKYAQVVVTNFAWGGMENTSATSLYDTVVLDRTALLDGDQDALLVHELAHQWMGDLITCRSWEHIWLNEGFATFAEAIWAQYGKSDLPAPRRGAPVSISGLRGDEDAYFWEIWTSFRDVTTGDTGVAPFQPAMVSKDFGHPAEVFDKDANPYPKGCAVLHMLREELGDELFFRAVRVFVDRHADQSVETYQFRRAVEDTTGRSLQRFFEQWCERPGVPRLDVDLAWDPDRSVLAVRVEQKQKIDGYNPAFALELPLWIEDGSRSGGRTVTVPMDGRSAAVDVPLSREPRFVAADPRLAVLADLRVHQYLPWWVEQLRSGPTLAAKLQAVAHLASTEAPDAENATRALRAVAGDPNAFRGLREEALAALGALAERDPVALDALAALAGRRTSDARVRAAQLGALAAAAEHADPGARARAVALLRQRFETDKSYRVRAEAVRGLGDLKAADAVPVIRAALATESQHDQIRKAALEALAAGGFPGGLDDAIRSAAHGAPPRTREAAIKAILALRHQDAPRAFNVLTALLSDVEDQACVAAAEALAAFPDPRAAGVLMDAARSARSRTMRYTLEKLSKQAEQPG